MLTSGFFETCRRYKLCGNGYMTIKMSQNSVGIIPRR